MRKRKKPLFSNLRQSRLFRLEVLIFGGYLTPAGRVVCLLTVLAGATAGARSSDWNSEVVPIVYFLAAFMMILLAMSCVLAYLLKPKLKIRRLKIPPTTAGHEFLVEVEIENLSKRPVYDLEVMELHLPESIHMVDQRSFPVIPRLGPGEKTKVQVRLQGTKRGSYTLKHLCAGSAYPFDICRGLRRSRQETSFLVYPTYTTPDTFTVPEGRRYQPGGFLVSSKVGESPEFMGTRDYRSGDNLRHIHWASWARVGKPIVKQYHEEFFVRLAIVVDSEVKQDMEDEVFETGVSLTAGIADYLSRRDYIIDIFAVGAQVYHFQSGRALAHFDNILQILACLESSPVVDWPSLWNQLLTEAPKLSAIVAVMTDWTPDRDEFTQKLKSLGVGMRVILINESPQRPPPPSFTDEEFIHIPPQKNPSASLN